MASGMLTMGAAYAIRIMIVREIGFEAAGLYQSAWTIGGLYVGFILRAMGADFYPRLTAVVKDRAECNRLVNEQAEVSLLLAGPGIIGTLALAPLVIPVLYSSAFGPAVEVLRWICLGATLQVITWPIGFIIVAEGRQGLFFWSEFAYTLLYMAMAWAFVRFQGLNGAGMAFFASYILHWLIVYPIVRWLTGFAWSRTNTPDRARVPADHRDRLWLPLRAPVLAGDGGGRGGARAERRVLRPHPRAARIGRSRAAPDPAVPGPGAHRPAGHAMRAGLTVYPVYVGRTLSQGRAEPGEGRA